MCNVLVGNLCIYPATIHTCMHTHAHTHTYTYTPHTHTVNRQPTHLLLVGLVNSLKPVTGSCRRLPIQSNGDDCVFNTLSLRVHFVYVFIFLFFIPFSVTRVEVNNYQEQRTIYNVIATIYGGVEPGVCVCVRACVFVCV